MDHDNKRPHGKQENHVPNPYVLHIAEYPHRYSSAIASLPSRILSQYRNPIHALDGSVCSVTSKHVAVSAFQTLSPNVMCSCQCQSVSNWYRRDHHIITIVQRWFTSTDSKCIEGSNIAIEASLLSDN